MKKSWMLYVVCICLTVASFPSGAELINFNWTTYSTSSAWDAGDYIDSRGYRFTNIEPRTTTGAVSICIQYAICNTNDSSILMTAVDGSLFDLDWLYSSRISNDSNDTHSAEYINIVGTLSTGGTVSFQTGDLQDSFLLADLPNSFSNLTSVLFDPAINSNNNPYAYSFMLDNISVATVSNVPLPAALYMFVAGLLGMIGIAKKKKAA